jgi:hypothetical protein
MEMEIGMGINMRMDDLMIRNDEYQIDSRSHDGIDDGSL